jgi:hypothetical protein
MQRQSNLKQRRPGQPPAVGVASTPRLRYGEEKKSVAVVLLLLVVVVVLCGMMYGCRLCFQYQRAKEIRFLCLLPPTSRP